MRRFIVSVSVVILVIAVAAFSVSAAFATEPQPEYTERGREINGLISLNDDTGITLVCRKVVFDIDGFPTSYSQYNGENVDDYCQCVTSTSIYKNDTDKDINLRMAMLCGRLGKKFSRFNDRYLLKVNGEVCEGINRYVYCNVFEEEDRCAKKKVSSLKDERSSYIFGEENAYVTEYAVTVENGPEDGYEVIVRAAIGEEERFFAGGEKFIDSGNLVAYRIPARNGDEIRFFSVGSQSGAGIDINVEKDGALVSCDIKETDRIVTTLSDYADRTCQLGDSEVVSTDWYNIIVGFLGDNSGDEKLNPFTNAAEFALSCIALIKEYDFVAKAGKETECVQISPIFPDIDENYRPAVFRYTYNDNVAAEESGEYLIDVEINTPYYLSGNPIYKKTEYGYAAQESNSAFKFSLSEDENPARVFYGNARPNIEEITFISMHVIWACEALTVVVFACVYLIRKRKEGARGKTFSRETARAILTVVICLLTAAAAFLAAMYYSSLYYAEYAVKVTVLTVSALISAAVTVMACFSLRKRKAAENNTSGEDNV